MLKTSDILDEKNKHLRDVIKDLSNIDEKTLLVLKPMIHALAQGK